jgi:hypothetical protein
MKELRSALIALMTRYGGCGEPPAFCWGSSRAGFLALARLKSARVTDEGCQPQT